MLIYILLSNKFKIIINLFLIIVYVNLVYRTIRFKERFGLDIENYDTKANTNRRHLIDFNIQAETYIMTFLYSPIKRMSFSTDFTKDERKIIHS